jgi:hypothetical protein
MSLLLGFGLALAQEGALPQQPTELRVHVRGGSIPVAQARVTAGDQAAVSDADGRVLLDLAPGTYHLRVEAEGYEVTEGDLTVPAGRVHLALRELAPPLEVVVEAFRPSSHAVRHAIDAELALETPGALDDSVRLVQSLPGVTTQREYSPGQSELSVRGSAPGDNRVYLDGVEVPYLYHYNQYASVFPTSQIGNLELFSSTFGAAYGDAVGAVVEAESRRERPERANGQANLNFVMAGGNLAAPLGEETWVSVAGRRSYLDLAGDESSQYPVFPRFYDFAARLERGEGDEGQGLFVWGAGDGYTRAAGELDLLDPAEQGRTGRFEHQRRFLITGGHHRWSSADQQGRVVLALVQAGRQGALDSGGQEDHRETTLSNRVDLRGGLTRAFGWEIGSELQLSRMALTVRDPGPEVLLVAEEAPALARGEPADGALLRALGGVYGTAHAQTGPLRWMPGLRVSADSTSPSVMVDPRFSANWRVADQTELSAAAGHYSQRPSSEQLFPGPGDPDLPTTRAWQAMVGLDQTVARRLELLVDLWGKSLRDPLALPVDAPPVALPQGRAAGLEIGTRYRLREVFFAWGWFGLGTSQIGEPGAFRPADADQRINVGLVSSWDIKRTNLGLRWRYASGLPYTGVEGSLYDAGRDQWVPQPGPDNGERLPAYTKVDLRVAHHFLLRRATLTTSFELWMVPPSATALYPAWNYDWTETQFVRGPPLLPLLGISVKS